MTLSSGFTCGCGEEASYYIDFERGRITGTCRYVCGECADEMLDAPDVAVETVRALPSLVEVKEAEL